MDLSREPRYRPSRVVGGPPHNRAIILGGRSQIEDLFRKRQGKISLRLEVFQVKGECESFAFQLRCQGWPKTLLERAGNEERESAQLRAFQLKRNSSRHHVEDTLSVQVAAQEIVYENGKPITYNSRWLRVQRIIAQDGLEMRTDELQATTNVYAISWALRGTLLGATNLCCEGYQWSPTEVHEVFRVVLCNAREHS